MKKRFALLLFPVLLTTGCSSIEVSPAEDGWDKTANKEPGVFTREKGELSFKIGQTPGADTSSPSQPSTPSHVGANSSRSNSRPDLQEFRAWQAWKKAKTQHSDEYLEFKEWLEFKAAASAEKRNTH